MIFIPRVNQNPPTEGWRVCGIIREIENIRHIKIENMNTESGRENMEGNHPNQYTKKGVKVYWKGADGERIEYVVDHITEDGLVKVTRETSDGGIQSLTEEAENFYLA